MYIFVSQRAQGQELFSPNLSLWGFSLESCEYLIQFVLTICLILTTYNFPAVAAKARYSNITILSDSGFPISSLMHSL